MNLSCTVVSVINMPSIMSTIMTMTLHGIPMMGTHLAMILIRQFQNSSRMLQNSSRIPRLAQRTTFANPVTIQNSTCTSRADRQDTIHCTVQNTMQSYCLEKQGDNTLFINSDQLLFTQQCPSRIIEVTVAFG